MTETAVRPAHFTVWDLLRTGRRIASDEGAAAKPAVICEEARLTFAELEERASRLASALAARGFTRGERAAVLLHNRIEYLEIFFALARLGGVIVPVNFLFKSEEVHRQLQDCGARWLFVQRSLYAGSVEPFRLHLGDTPLAVVSLDDEIPESLRYADLIASGEPEGVDVTVDESDLFVLQYTSGTTGRPKGAMHTHATVLANSQQQLGDFGITSADKYLSVPALCWAAGFHMLTLATLWAGGTVVLHPSGKLDASALVCALERTRATMVVLVPSVLRLFLEQPIEHADLSALRRVHSGAEPVRVHLLQELLRRLPDIELIQVYGLTEHPVCLTYLEPRFAESKIGSSGRPSRIVDLKIVDADGGELPRGEPGEIVHRSPALVVGYHNRPEETAHAFRGGYYHTGDRGYLDDEGFLHVQGRIKDMIISGGLNVYPAEVERIIEAHPAIAEAAVVGAPDERFGEVGRAHIVLRDGIQVTEEELAEHVRRDLADYKVPRRWVTHDEPLPRTASGKLQKFKLTTPTPS